MITCPKCHANVDDQAQFCGNCGKPLDKSGAAAKDSFVGKCIDKKYYVRELIASGGMGEVYLAIQKPARQEVAIKKLHEEYYRDKTVVERFMTEAHTYARVSHPNAVRLYDLLNINGQICIVMEYVRGRTLTSYIESGYVFSPRQIIDICLQIADALGTVHQTGIIHRDLKTENIMLMETVSGRFSPKILDFGIAKIKENESKGKCQTEEGILVGTPEFMSPEQCYGQDIDHRSDIYSFGIILYVMVCNKLPFIADTAMGLLQKQVGEPTPACERIDGSEVPAGFEAIIGKCMMKNRDDRYQSFADVITDLECLREHRETSIAMPLSAISNSETVEMKKEEKSLLTAETVEAPMDSQEFRFSIENAKAIELDEIELDEEDSEEESEDSNVVDDMIDEDGDGEGFSLGEIDDLEESSEAHHAIEKKKESHGGAVIGVILFLIVVAGIGCALLKTGKIDASALGVQLPAFLQPEAAAPEVPENPVKAPVAEETPVVPENQGAAVENTAPVAAPVVEAVPEPDPVAPCAIVTRDLMERGIGRVMLNQAGALLNEGKLTEALDMIHSAEEKKTVFAQAELDTLNKLNETHVSYSGIMTQAEKARRGENCKTISDLAAALPDEAVGLKTQLTKMAQKCNAVLAAPPSML